MVSAAARVKTLAYAVCALHGILTCRQLFGCRGLSQYAALTPATLIAAINALLGLDLERLSSSPADIAKAVCEVGAVAKVSDMLCMGFVH